MTVVARRFAATPIRTATETWTTMVNVISKEGTAARAELMSVRGVMASVIADEWPKDAAIVVAGNGPRLRMYCLYGAAAIEGDDRDENTLSWTPTEGDWQMYIPCESDDLKWVSAAVKKSSSRIVAYDLKEGLPATAKDVPEVTEEVTIDVEVFKRL